MIQYHVGRVQGINRYMLGCKSKLIDIINDYDLELIDTCWDVNKLEMITGQGNNAELIDTCWDVN